MNNFEDKHINSWSFLILIFIDHWYQIENFIYFLSYLSNNSYIGLIIDNCMFCRKWFFYFSNQIVLILAKMIYNKTAWIKPIDQKITLFEKLFISLFILIFPNIFLIFVTICGKNKIWFSCSQKPENKWRAEYPKLKIYCFKSYEKI